MAKTVLCIGPANRLPTWRSALPASIDLVHAESMAAAKVMLAATRGNAFLAALVDLPGGIGADVEEVRAVAPLLPMLALLHTPNALTINLLHALRCELLCGRLDREQLRDFLERAQSAGRLSSRSVDDWIRRMMDRRQLRAGDLALIPVVLGEKSVEEARERLGYTPEQMTRRMRALCRRCGARTAVGAHRNLMREALVHGRFPQRARAQRGGLTAVA